MLEAVIEFIVKLIARVAGARAAWTASLNHEVWNHPMELEAVVKAFCGQLLKVFNGIGCFVGMKLYGNISAVSLNCG